MSAEPTAARSPSAAPRAQPNWLSPSLLVASGFGLGRVAVAPGTVGGLLGVPLAVVTGSWASRTAGRLPALGPWAEVTVEAGLVAAVCAAGVFLCDRAARMLGGKDPGAVVIDEIASYPLALLVVPAVARTPLVLAIAFVLLRAFDIAKPFPCRRLERLPGGLGIMADDWAAAGWCAACLAAARWLHWL